MRPLALKIKWRQDILLLEVWSAYLFSSSVAERVGGAQPTMLAADRMLLESNMRQRAIQLREKEINLFTENFSSVGNATLDGGGERGFGALSFFSSVHFLDVLCVIMRGAHDFLLVWYLKVHRPPC